MTLGERIKKVRKEQDLTQQRFAERIGIKQNSIALIESGKRNISDQAILSICREFGVNEEWLRTGKGEMMKAAPANELDALAEKYRLQHKDYVLIKKLLKMPQEQRDGVYEFMKSVMESSMAGGADPYALEFPPKRKNIHDWTDAEMHAELQRQLDAEKEETDESSISSSGNSGTATA